MELNIGTVIALASLIISSISFFQSSKSQKLQDKVNKLEMKIKQNELDIIEKEKTKASYECVEAIVMRISSRQTKLKVWNSGNTIVYNVRASFAKGTGIIILDENKMPFDELEPGKSFEVPLITHYGSAKKFKITTSWDNKEGTHGEKEQMGDL